MSDKNCYGNLVNSSRCDKVQPTTITHVTQSQDSATTVIGWPDTSSLGSGVPPSWEVQMSGCVTPHANQQPES